MTNRSSEEDSADFKETTPPRDVTIERAMSDLYKDLQNESSSPYQGAQQLEIFVIAAAVGSYQGLRQPLEGDRMSLFNVGSLKENHHTIIRSLAWRETHEEEVYYDQARAFKIAMEFANGGIRHLHKSKLGIGDNVSDATTDVITRWNELKSDLEERSLIEQTD